MDIEQFCKETKQENEFYYEVTITCDYDDGDYISRTQRYSDSAMQSYCLFYLYLLNKYVKEDYGIYNLKNGNEICRLIYDYDLIYECNMPYCHDSEVHTLKDIDIIKVENGQIYKVELLKTDKTMEQDIESLEKILKEL